MKNLKDNLLVLEKNTIKYINFTVLIKEEVTRVDKNGKEITKTISYRLKFIDSAIFMASSLSGPVIITLKEFVKLNLKMNMILKNAKRVELNSKISTASLNTQTFPLDETHLDAVRGLILLKGFHPVHQQVQLVGAMRLSSTRTNRSAYCLCQGPDSKLKNSN